MGPQEEGNWKKPWKDPNSSRKRYRGSRIQKRDSFAMEEGLVSVS
jgi:hypothetical protein